MQQQCKQTVARGEPGQLQFLTDTIADGTWQWEAGSDRVVWSARVYEILGLPPGTRAPSYAHTLSLIHPEDLPRFEMALEACLANGESYQVDLRLRHTDGRYIWIRDRGSALHDAKGIPQRALGILSDITAQKHNEVLLATQSRILADLASDAPTEQILTAIVKLAEQQRPGARGALLVLDERRRHLRHAAAPNLPAAYVQALDRQALGDDPLAYATALHRQETAIAADLANDTSWRDHREFALAHGLQACWSVPISVANAGILGVFTLYFDTPCQPTAADWQALESALCLARLCLERERNRQIRSRQVASMEAAIDGIAILIGDTYCYLNTAHCHLYGYDRPEDLIGKTWQDLYTPEEVRRFEREILPQLQEQGSWRGEATGRRRNGSTFPQELSLTLTADGSAICVCRDASARATSAKALRESEQRFRKVAEVTNDFIYEWNLTTGTFDWFGGDVERALGYLPRTFPRTFAAWQEILHPEDLPQVLAAIARHLETGEPSYQEYRVRHADGGYRYWSDSSSILRAADGQPVTWVGANTDISERKQTEKALRESQQRYAALTESAPVGIFHADLQGNCLYVNDRWCELAGLSRAEARGFGWTRALHPEDRDRALAEWYTSAKEQRAFSLEYRFRHPEDGRTTWVFGQAAAEYTPDGTHVGYIGTITDISLRKETEEALKHSRQLLRQVIDNIPQVISWTDERLVYIGCNQRAAEMAGLGAPIEIIGKRDRDLAWAPGQAEWSQHCAQRILSSGQPELHVVESQQQPDGQQRWFDTNRIPLHDDTGAMTGLLVTLEDITDRLAAERQLQSFSASLRHLHRLSTCNFKSMEDLLAAYLQAGCEMLDLPTATIAQMAEDDQCHLEFVHTIDANCDRLVPGMQVDSREMVCELTLQRQQTVALASLQKVPEVRDRAVCRDWGFDCCLSTPIWVEREIYGTLNFFAPQARPTPFEAHERETVELMARDIGRFIVVQRSECQRREAEEALRRSEEKYRSIFENITQGIFQATPAGRYLSANPFLAKLLGYASPEAMMVAITDIGNQVYVNPQRRQELARLTERRGAVYGFESQVYRRDGSAIWISENQHSVQSEDGELLYYEGTVEDITARRQAEEQLQYDAFHDKLTGLHNRAWFVKQLEGAIASCHRDRARIYGVLFIDLDRFKVINDSLGHLVGDELLKQVAQRLTDAVRVGDTLARFGGDEFAVLLLNIRSVGEAVGAAERFVAQLQKPIHLNGQEFGVGASIGIALGNPDYQRPEELLRDADLAMYRAKASGGNRHALFEKAMLPQAVARLRLEHDLQRAIELDELSLHYQPIFCLNSGKLTGFEALLRWQHGQKGWIGPGDFIPISEETGAIETIGWWAFEQSCRQLQQWLQRFPALASEIVLHINVSGVQLKQPNFAVRVLTLLHDLKLPSCTIGIEITETSFLEVTRIDAQMLECLRSLGCRLCIDDFGTGYSSLSRLHRLSVDTIKIDRAFVDGIDRDKTKAAIAQTIISLAHNLGAKTVSEGIETITQQRKLQELGCKFGQGYLLSRPLKPQAIGQLLGEIS